MSSLLQTHMETEFEDISITGVSKERSYQLTGPTFRIFLTLSSEPPGGWVHLFDGVWQDTFYMMKRRAGIDENMMWIDCAPAELKQYHLEELKKAATETNARYHTYLKQEGSALKAREEQQRQE